MEFFGLRWDRWKSVFWIMPCFVIVMMVLGALLKLSGWQGWVEATYGAKQQVMVELMQNSSDFALMGAIVFSAVIIAPIGRKFFTVWPRMAGRKTTFAFRSPGVSSTPTSKRFASSTGVSRAH